MKTKTAYAVFTKTTLGLEYMVKGNFGNDKDAAEKWKEDKASDTKTYPRGLFVKLVKY